MASALAFAPCKSPALACFCNVVNCSAEFGEPQPVRKTQRPELRPGGIILAVHIANPANEQRVISALRAEGAADIEQAEGEWRDGDWTDFNPVAAPQLVPLAINALH